MPLFIFKPNIYLQPLSTMLFYQFFLCLSLPYYKHAIGTLKYNIKKHALLNFFFQFIAYNLPL